MKFTLSFAMIVVGLLVFSSKGRENSDPGTMISKTWKLSSYAVNDVDRTGDLLISCFTEKLEDYDFYGYSYWYVNGNQDTVRQMGSTYRLYANGDSISFYSSLEIPLTVGDTLQGYRKCRILHLSEESLAYEFSLNGALHEFEMVRIGE